MGNDAVNINEIAAKVKAENSRSPEPVYFCAGRRKRAIRRFRHGDGCGEAAGITNISIVTQPLETTCREPLKSFSNTTAGGARWHGLAGLHVGVTVFIFLLRNLSRWVAGRRLGLGRRRSAIGATLVSSVPLPATPAPTQNVLANESKGLTQSNRSLEEKEPDAIEIQGKNTKVRPKKIVTVTKKSQSRNRKRKATRLPSAKVDR